MCWLVIALGGSLYRCEEVERRGEERIQYSQSANPPLMLQIFRKKKTAIRAQGRCDQQAIEKSIAGLVFESPNVACHFGAKRRPTPHCQLVSAFAR